MTSSTSEKVNEGGIQDFCRLLGTLPAGANVALTGGNSAALFYDAWTKCAPTHFNYYWSDERVVPRDDPDSNYKLGLDHLLRPAAVKAEHIHPAPVALAPAACAHAYAAAVPPKFDLIILGLGEDGHTGSLFPGRDPYVDDFLLVRAVEPTAAHPHPRITFTPRLMNAAARVCFVVSGAHKAWALGQLRRRTAEPMRIPALVVDPAQTALAIYTA